MIAVKIAPSCAFESTNAATRAGESAPNACCTSDAPACADVMIVRTRQRSLTARSRSLHERDAARDREQSAEIGHPIASCSSTAAIARPKTGVRKVGAHARRFTVVSSQNHTSVAPSDITSTTYQNEATSCQLHAAAARLRARSQAEAARRRRRAAATR